MEVTKSFPNCIWALIPKRFCEPVIKLLFKGKLTLPISSFFRMSSLKNKIYANLLSFLSAKEIINSFSLLRHAKYLNFNLLRPSLGPSRGIAARTREQVRRSSRGMILPLTSNPGFDFVLPPVPGLRASGSVRRHRLRRLVTPKRISASASASAWITVSWC